MQTPAESEAFQVPTSKKWQIHKASGLYWNPTYGFDPTHYKVQIQKHSVGRN